MCNKENVKTYRFAPNVYLKFYKNIFQQAADTFLKVTNQTDDLGKEVVLVIPACDTCQNKYRNISLLDFKTKGEGERIIKSLIQPYVENGYKKGSIYVDGWSTKSRMSLAESDVGDYFHTYILKTTPDIFERHKLYIELLALAFNLRDIPEAQTLSIVNIFFEDSLEVPEHELFIYYSYFVDKLKNSVGMVQVCKSLYEQGDETLNRDLQLAAYRMINMDDPDKLLAKELIGYIDPTNVFM
jgi:hypothetical protein